MSTMIFAFPRYPDDVARWLVFVVICGVILFHAGILFLLWRISGSHRVTVAATPIMVEILAGGGNSGSGDSASGGAGARAVSPLPVVKPKIEKPVRMEKSVDTAKPAVEKVQPLAAVSEPVVPPEPVPQPSVAPVPVSETDTVTEEPSSVLSAGEESNAAGEKGEGSIASGDGSGETGAGSGESGQGKGQVSGDGGGNEPVETVSESAVRYRRRPDPAYPVLSRRRQEEGSVVLRVLVGENGRPGEVTVSRSSGFSRLDAAAVKAVKAAEFYPYRKDGVPVSVWTSATIHFRLTEE